MSIGQELLPDRFVDKTFIYTNEIAQELGVTEWTVREWIKDKQLKAVKISRTWRVRPKHLAVFLASRANTK